MDLSYLEILNFHQNIFIFAKIYKKYPLIEEEKQFNRETPAICIKIAAFNAKFKTS